MRRALAVLLPVLLLTGCAPSADAAYLSTVRESSPALRAGSDADLIALGKQVCSIFDEFGIKKGFPEIVKQWQDSGVNAGDVVGPAVAAYCPKYSDYFH